MLAPELATGLVAGEAAGDPTGLVDATGTGVGDADGFTSGVLLHAPKAAIPAAKTTSRTDLLNVFVFICFPCQPLFRGVTNDCGPAVLSVGRSLCPTPRILQVVTIRTSGLNDFTLRKHHPYELITVQERWPAKILQVSVKYYWIDPIRNWESLLPATRRPAISPSVSRKFRC